MTFTQRPYRSGDLFGHRYYFPHRGDGIPMHAHEREMAHNVVVLRGAVEVYGPGARWRRVLLAGDVYDLPDEREPHEIVALRPETETLHLYRYGLPEAYAEMTDDELSGTGDRPLTIPLP